LLSAIPDTRRTNNLRMNDILIGHSPAGSRAIPEGFPPGSTAGIDVDGQKKVSSPLVGHPGTFGKIQIGVSFPSEAHLYTGVFTLQNVLDTFSNIQGEILLFQSIP